MAPAEHDWQAGRRLHVPASASAAASSATMSCCTVASAAAQAQMRGLNCARRHSGGPQTRLGKLAGGSSPCWSSHDMPSLSAALNDASRRRAGRLAAPAAGHQAALLAATAACMFVTSGACGGRQINDGWEPTTHAWRPLPPPPLACVAGRHPVGPMSSQAITLHCANTPNASFTCTVH